MGPTGLVLIEEQEVNHIRWAADSIDAAVVGRMTNGKTPHIDRPCPGSARTLQSSNRRRRVRVLFRHGRY